MYTFCGRMGLQGGECSKWKEKVQWHVDYKASNNFNNERTTVHLAKDSAV